MRDRPSDSWQNFKLEVAYDGRGFMGWQRLRGERTVQGELENACTRAFGGASAVQGAGRTDRGVHARGQVATVRLPVAEADLLERLEPELPSDLEVLRLHAVSPDFQAREAAIGKEYRYVLWVGDACPAEREGRVWHLADPLDQVAMRAAAAGLRGARDFASFAKPSRQASRAATVRELHSVRVVADGSEVAVVVRGRSFLYKMVRNLVRALVRVGEGRWSVSDLEAALAARDRAAAPGTAPASGLWLDRVFYEEADYQHIDG